MSTSPRFQAFEPVLGPAPRFLILGTFPSPLSRARDEYYGNPRNHFWRIIFDIYEHPFENPTYEQKTQLLITQGIALWDVLQSCSVVGAADTAISDPMYNCAILDLLRDQPSIKRVLFNGGNGYRFFRRGLGELATQQYLILPSTSPANARIGYADKLLAWKQALRPSC